MIGGSPQPRLCMIVHGPYPPDTRVARAVRVALAEGWAVDVVATRQPGDAPEELVEGATVIRLPVEHRWGGGAARVAQEYIGFTLLACVWAALRTPTRRYRVVHVNNPPDFLILAAAAPRLAGATIVLDLHDLSPDMFAMRFGNGRGARVAHRVLFLVERVAARYADVVITVHDAYRRELVRRGVAAEKLVVVMNTVDVRAVPAAVARRSATRFRIVYHGTVTPPYGLPLLVRALATIADEAPDSCLEIYGGGDALHEVASLAEALAVRDRVWLSGGFLPHAEVLAGVQRASVGVIPNLPTPLSRFALSTKLFEYVALRIPVVCADLPTMREHFSDDEVLFFEAGNADALANALLEVRRDPRAAHARVEAASRRYEQYSWEANAIRYARVLAAARHGRSPRRA